jgi:hypothetical protein
MLSTALTTVVFVPVLLAGVAGQQAFGPGTQVPAEKQQSASPMPDPAPTPPPSPNVATTKSPYANLFIQPIPAAQEMTPQPAAKPEVLCGLMVIEVDPNIDPKIIVAPKPGNPDPKIRRISPSVCRE